MALNTWEMWSNGVKTSFFFKKLRKIAQRLPIDSGGYGLRPPTRICDTFELQNTYLLNTSPNLDIFTFIYWF